MIEHNGKMYARVSEILQPYTNFTNIDPKVLANKCRIGTEVHQAIADDINDDFIYLQKDSIGYFHSYEKWKDALKPVFKQSEQRYFCDKKMITGQIDCLITCEECLTKKHIVSEALMLCDFKTSVNECKESWPMQGHLYNYLLIQNNILPYVIFLFIKLDKNGKMPQAFAYKYDSNINAKCMQAIDNFWNK
jgi:hypothetical protein